MEHKPKIEPGLSPNDHRNLEDMSIQQLVSVLRTAFRTEQFDRVEEILVSRYERLQTEILHLQEKFDLEILMRFQTEEDLRKREELCERGKRAQSNYETLLEEVKKTSLVEGDIIRELRKKNNKLELEVCELRKLKEKWSKEALPESSSDRDIIGELRKKNNELDLEVCELKKLKEKWVDDRNALSELRIRVRILETSIKKNSELEKSLKTNSEALGFHWITDFEDTNEENVGEYETGNDTVERNTLQRNEPPSKRSKNAQGASSVTAQTRGATVEAAYSRDGHPITSLCRECAARHAPIVEERENENAHISEEVIVMDSVVVSPSDLQGQMTTQNIAKSKKVAADTSSSSFDNFHFISLVHQDRYSKFLAGKKFVLEKKFCLEGKEFSDIQAMIVARGWVELTSFAEEASTTLAKEFFANAYQGPSKDGNNKNDLKQFTSFVRGKKVPFHDKIINQLFGLENNEECSFEARKAKGSNIDHQEIHSTLCRPEADWVRNNDGTPSRLHTTSLTPIAKAWATFVLHTLLPCSNTSDLTIQKATLLTAILKGEPVNVGRLLADSLWGTSNCSSPTSYINHASLINKLCESVGVYPKKNEEMVKPSLPITAKWIKRYSCN